MEIEYPYIDFDINLVSHSGIGHIGNSNIKILSSKTPKYALPEGFNIFAIPCNRPYEHYKYAKWFSIYYIERVTAPSGGKSYIYRKLITRIYRHLKSEANESFWCMEFNGSIPEDMIPKLEKVKRFAIEYAEKFKV